MAKQGKGLAMKASLDINEAMANAKKLNDTYKQLILTANGVSISPASSGANVTFSTKPLTEYQKELIRIKEETLALAKAKQETAAADRAASLATQAALKEESRLKREQIANEKALKAEQAKRKPTQISNSQAEIDAYNNLANGSKEVTTTLNKQNLAQAELTNGLINNSKAVKENDTAEKSNNLTKKQSAQLLVEEKYIQQQNTAALKNNAREMLNAKGSIEQRRAALIRLNSAYDKLSATERATPAGQRLQSIVSGVTTQVKELESATGRAQRNVGNYSNAFTKGFSSIWSLLRNIANIIPGLGLGGLVLLLSKPITLLIDKMGVFKSSLEKLSEAQKVVNASQQEATSILAKETAETTLSISKINDKNTSIATRQNLLNEFINKNPSILGALNLQNIATQKGTDIINDYILALRNKLELQQLEVSYASAIQKQADIRSGKEDTGVGFLGKSALVAKRVLLGGQGKSLTEEIDQANARLKAQADVEQEGVIKAIEGQIKAKVEGQSKIKQIEDSSLKSLESRLSSTNERLRNLQKGESYKTLKAEKLDLEKQIKQRSQILGLDKPSNSGDDSLLKSRNALQLKITELTTKSLRTQQNADDAEVESVRDKYRKIDQEIEAFNKRSKGKYKIDASGLPTAEKNEVQSTIDKQSNARFKIQLAEQTKDFEEFESYKLQYGIEAANKRYQTEFTTAEAYMQKLEDLQTGILNKYGDPSGYSEAQKQELAIVTDQIITFSEKRKSIDDSVYANAFNAAKTYADKALDIEKEFQRDKASLEARGEATPERIANLQKEKDARIRSVNEENAYAKSGYEELMMHYDELTRKQIIDKLNAIKEGYRKEYAEGKLTAEQLANLTEQVNSNISKLNGNNAFKNITQAIKDYKAALKTANGDKNVEGVIKAQANMADAIGQGAAQINEALGAIADTLDQLGIGGEELQKVFKNVSGIISGAADIAKGDPVSVITGSLKILTSAINLFNTKDAKIAKRIKQYQADLDSLGKAYKQLERDIQNSVGNDVYSKQNDEIANLQAQQQKLIQIRDAEASKKKKDQNKINDLNSQIDDIPGKIEDIQNSISQNLIQGTFRDLSNSLADALSSAFKTGEDGIAAMDKSFDDFIANAIKSSLKLALLEPVVSQFTKELTEYAKGHGNSVVGFDFDAWRKKLNDAGESFNKGLEESKDFFKGDNNTDSPSGLKSNALTASLDQPTGERLEGLWRGQFDLTKKIDLSTMSTASNTGQLYQQAIATFNETVKISANTLRTADNTERLANIEKALVSMDGKMVKEKSSRD